mmetsp:Transcript_42907/g.112761  ORF Transcript_42907/g.112761 Transcript_42907/m.112761 type:complete len:204 (-) Transcript_42907:165-776(-)
MPAGRTFCARGLRLSVRPSATRFTRPVAQMRTGSFVSLWKYFQQTSSCFPTSFWSKAGATLPLSASTVSAMPASTRRCISACALDSSSYEEKSAFFSISLAPSSTAPSCPRSRLICWGSAASVGSRLRRCCTISSSKISLRSERRWSIEPTLASLLDDHRVAYCDQPSAIVRISICFLRNSSCCISGLGLGTHRLPTLICWSV